ncbi:MAG: hypothetical protein Q9M92_12250 [Enterobacterales bacterium]|nr:hypothetical protein [Enterobacterales bacterium]
MPGAVPRTSTFALNNATLPFIISIANKGYQAALEVRSSSYERPTTCTRVWLPVKVSQLIWILTLLHLKMLLSYS